MGRGGAQPLCACVLQPLALIPPPCPRCRLTAAAGGPCLQALWGKYHHMHSTLKDAECVVVWGSAGPPPSAVTATGTAQHQPPSAPAS